MVTTLAESDQLVSRFLSRRTMIRQTFTNMVEHAACDLLMISSQLLQPTSTEFF